MSEQRPSSERRPTGIEGLDRILEGGLLVAGVYIVQGPPGAGKTILANQTCFNHAATGGHAVYVTLLAESHSRMFAHLRRMAFFDESAIPDRVYYIGGYRALEAEGLDALVTLIRGAIQKHKATLLVVDGLISAQESSPTDREFKKFLHEIQTLADVTGLHRAAPDQRANARPGFFRSTRWSTACCISPTSSRSCGRSGTSAS